MFEIGIYQICNFVLCCCGINVSPIFSNSRVDVSLSSFFRQYNPSSSPADVGGATKYVAINKTECQKSEDCRADGGHRGIRVRDGAVYRSGNGSVEFHSYSVPVVDESNTTNGREAEKRENR